MIKYIFLKVHPTIKNIAKEIINGEAVITDTIYSECSDELYIGTSESELVKTSNGYVIEYCHLLYRFYIKLYKHENEIILNNKEKRILGKALEKFLQDKKTAEETLSRTVLNSGKGYNEKKEIK